MKEEIGNRIKKIREDMGMTKEGFAKQLGISGQYLGLIERGQNYLSIEKLKVLCELTDLTADYILFGKDINIISDTKAALAKYDDKQIAAACYMLKRIAIIIKNK